MKSFTRFILAALVLIPLANNAQKINLPIAVYQSDALLIIPLTENVYIHTSFLHSETFGKVPCNGMIVVNKQQAVIFDTPTDDSSSVELIGWIKNKLNCNITGVISTHFHEDCVGGLKAFHKSNIPSYALNKTIKLAKERGFNAPENGFKKSLKLTIGDKNVFATFFGEGHTRDNIVGYFPDERIMFGGCLIKALDAPKGNLEDANVQEWSNTVLKLKNKYPDVRVIIPGHGEYGDKTLLDYTINLFGKD